jgi:hypothetical protein
MIPKKLAPAKAGVADFSDKLATGFARPAADETLVFCYRASRAVEFVSS